MNNTTTQSDSIRSKIQPKPVLKVAIDAHASRYVIAVQIDGSAPKPPQRFDQTGLLRWLGKQLQEGFKVVSCYEAGPFGFVLHRQLLALGVENYVIRPRNWDDQSRRVKTDRTDARAMLNALDRFVSGNRHALTVVQVPTVEQERRRSQSRVRESLLRQLKAAAQRGRGLALLYGYRLRGEWFGVRRWPSLEVPLWLKKLLAPLRVVALVLWRQLQECTKAVEAQSVAPRPCGVGRLSEQILEREVGDWNRFKNRRQVGSFFGLCPSEFSSGSSRRKGSITKTGNRRVRQVLCQLAWLLWRYQPDYRLVKKWHPSMRLASQGRRKQIIVALARGFAVDWWRLRTGQTTPQRLGLQM